MSPEEQGWLLAYELELPEATPLLQEWTGLPLKEQDKYRAHLSGLILNEVDHQIPARHLLSAWIHVERFALGQKPTYPELQGGLNPLLDVLCCPKIRNPHGLSFIVDKSPQFLQRVTAQAEPMTPNGERTRVRIYRHSVARLAA